MTASKEDPIKKTLDNLSEAAASLGCHGYEGYSIDSSALDVVFLRSLTKLKDALGNADNDAYRYDPGGAIYDVLPNSDYD